MYKNLLSIKEDAEVFPSNNVSQSGDGVYMARCDYATGSQAKLRVLQTESNLNKSKPYVSCIWRRAVTQTTIGESKYKFSHTRDNKN